MAVIQPNENSARLGTFTYNPRFPGQVYDAETGLYYNYHRSYNPSIGAYTQSDPIGLAGGINTYAYVGGNPVGFVDPLGLETSSMSWGSRFGAAGAAAATDGPLPIGDLVGAGIIAKGIYDACKPDNNDCIKIEQEAKETANKIRERYFAMLKDPNNLYNKAYCKPNRSRGTTYIGHADQIKSWQNRLRNKIAEADAKSCKVDLMDRALLGLTPPICPAK